LEIIFGYLLAVVVGITSGIVVVKSTAVRYALLPYSVYLYALPAAIIAPLFVVWMPSYFLSAVLFVAWVTFFIIFINTITGFQEIDEEFYHLGKSYGATSTQFISKIEFWEALPHISSGLKIAVQQAIVAAIVIEFIATTGGIGHLLVTALELLRPGLLFGVLILIMMFAITFYKSVTFAIDVLTPGLE
jgi:NitT/TauT family transport system permease protein